MATSIFGGENRHFWWWKTMFSQRWSEHGGNLMVNTPKIRGLSSFLPLNMQFSGYIYSPMLKQTQQSSHFGYTSHWYPIIIYHKLGKQSVSVWIYHSYPINNTVSSHSYTSH
jgi:hypothetical protein